MRSARPRLSDFWPELIDGLPPKLELELELELKLELELELELERMQ